MEDKMQEDLVILLGVICVFLGAILVPYGYQLGKGRGKRKRKRKTLARQGVIITGAICVALGALLIPYGYDLRNKKIQAITGELKPPKIDFEKPFEVNLGSNIWILSISQLSEGINLSNFVNVGYPYPIQIEFREGNLLVSAEIKNEEGETVAKIKDNQWTVNENKIIARDRNYNSYAFEVINSDLIPVLQVIVKEQNKIYIGGLFYIPSGKVLVTPSGLYYNPSPATIDEEIEPIFRYPSAEHLGEMAKTN